MRIVLLFSLAPAALFAQVAQLDTAARADTNPPPQRLEAVTVSAIRAGAGGDAPIAQKTLTLEEIERRSFGQDVPLLLQGTPSLTSYSEAANHWGYSYMRLRGIDQSRINLTLDGIPLNDPEDQVLYFADFPDLANSVSSVQIQRGVGTSAPGTASYGGSINFQTMPLAAANRGTDLQLQGGSFGSLRGSAEYATGLTSGGFALYSRVSALQSAGYRNHSGMEGRSAFLSAGYVRPRDMIKVTVLAGLFADTLSYLGATPAELTADRRHNPLRPDEVDRFGEQVAALSYTRQLTDRASLSATAYRLSASGNYDVCVDLDCAQPAAALWNFNLDFTWYGATVAWTLERDGLRASAGVNGNTYARDHHAYDRADMAQPLYFNTGHKDDGSAFAKLSYDVGESPVTLFADLQGRRAAFRYSPDANAGIPTRSIAWTFVNPKAGITVRHSPSLSSFVSFGMNSREPGRADMFGGFDNLDTTNADFVGPLDRVRPERVRDLEAGMRMDGRHWSLDANAFAMSFTNEILPVGELSYIGTPLRTNVPSSWRRGVEVDGAVSPLPGLRLSANATAMRGRIASFTDDASGQSYAGVEPLLTPRFTSGQRVAYDLSRTVTLELAGRYASRSFLTNTGDPALTLPAHFVADLATRWRRGDYEVTLHVNNVGNSRRYAGGHVAFGEARYYVLPPVNAFLMARLLF